MLIELKEKRVCAVCVGEPYLKEAIALDDCLIISICDYCRERVTTGSIHVSPRVVIDETKEVFLHLGPFEPDQRKPSLEIDFEPLTLHTIEAVEVIAEQQPVIVARGPLDDY